MLLRYLLQHGLQRAIRSQLEQAGRAASNLSGETAESAEDAIAELGPVRAGFVFALEIEAGGIIDALEDAVTPAGTGWTERLGRFHDHTVAIVQSGVGQEAAASATADLLRVRRPEWVISAGFAGGLTGEMRRGDILMADSVVDSEGHALQLGLRIDPDALEGSPGVHAGRLLTVDQLVRGDDQRQQLHAEHSALAVDMETAAVAQVCRDSQVRCISVRIISDTVGDVLPPEIERLLDQESTAARVGAALGALVRRPSAAKDLWKLKEDAVRAADRLGRFLAGVLPQLVD